ncbi:MAG: hypothetical protein ACOC9W_03885 [Persicimonas sp.]
MSEQDGYDDLERQRRLDQHRREQANRPGLDAIDYRIGTYSSFFERMLQRLHRQEVPAVGGGPNAEPERPLDKLRTRSSDDPAIAMLDAWATVSDVLTFYQERIANEHYLRTAVEPRSVTELARLVGYEPDPGVAASTRLAFSVDDSPQGPLMADVPAGTQVQSVPEKGELPQTFETDADFAARPEWNELDPRLDRPQYLAIADSTLYMVDSDGTLGGDGTTSKNLDELRFVGPDLPLPPPEDRPDDLASQSVRVQKVNVFYLDGVHDDLRRGDPILLVGTPLYALSEGSDKGEHATLLRRLESVTPQPDKGRTAVRVGAYDRSGTSSGSGDGQVVMMVASFEEAPHAATATVQSVESQQEQYFRAVQANSSLELKKRALRNHVAVAETVMIAAEAERQTSPPDAERGIVFFERRAGFFGSNAPAHQAVAKAYEDNPFGDDWDANEYEIWDDYSLDDTTKAGNSRSNYGGADVYLERVVDDVEVDDWVVFVGRDTGGDAKEQVYRVGDVAEQSVTGFSLSARATGLRLADPSGGDDLDKPAFGVRSTTAFVGNRQMSLARVPMPEGLGSLRANADGGGVDGVKSLAIDGVHLNFETDQEVIIGGERLDAPGRIVREVARLSAVDYAGSHTILRFSDSLEYAYRRDTVAVYANVVRATHGESRSEVLGSGDASQKHQSFTLSKPPLTYVPSRGGSGSTSTLEIRVDGVLWPEVDSLAELGPDDEAYVVRVDERQKTRVTFGDGVHGARLPSGRENVVASYRSGIGLAGEVGEGRLTLLKKRPAGIRKVTNPVAAADAADPESRDDTRKNAPRDTRLLERVVSLQDYADFARNYGGVGKARAELISRGGRTAVHLTVGGTSAEGATVGDERQADLAASLADVSSTRYRVEVRSLDVARFGVQAAVSVDDRYIAEDVLAAVEARLEDVYGYRARGFSEPVSAASVISTIQAVDGVVAVFLKALYSLAEDKSLERVLIPQSTRYSASNGRFMAAQLLFIEPEAIELSEA